MTTILNFRSTFLRFQRSMRCFGSVQNGCVVGILRETYNIWERRAPLGPNHVEILLKKYRSSGDLDKVIVQPSNARIFSDRQYLEAGAVVQEDLSEADLILGVKRPLDEETLIPGKAYAFFSHVIKGQPQNMALLKRVLESKIQLFDYECIVEGGMSSAAKPRDRKQKRLVAFGRFAGIAGVNDALHALGRRLLHRGFCTPFLHIPQSYIYSDWNQAKQNIRLIGEEIARDGLAMESLVFCVTGRGGNAHSGAMEVIQELPHQIVTIDQLPAIAALQGPHHHIFVLQVGTSEVFAHQGGNRFDRSLYEKHPDQFTSVLCDCIAKFTSILVNTAYWNERFPRVFTKQNIRDLWESSDILPRLQIVADISCDINGSIEFLHRTTSIERPFFEYDPHLGCEISDDITGEGITVMGVDILPSELPKDSSEHFGNVLLPYIGALVENKEQANGTAAIVFERLPVEISDACIAVDGELTQGFRYLQSLMHQRQSKQMPQQDFSMILSLEGHLFDSALVNQCLDLIESQNCSFEILECNVRRSDNGSPQKSLVVLKISAINSEALDKIHYKLTQLSNSIDAADAMLHRQDTPRRRDISVQQEIVQTVLVLGSGMVANSAVEYLRRRPGREIIIAGEDDSSTRSVARQSFDSCGKYFVFNVLKNPEQLARLVDEANLVVSLLPATFHSLVADVCIDKRTNMVTASYESGSMRELNEKAISQGVSILNEVGLDPGLDHMSAMRIIDDIRDRGGTVSCFASYCGGIPSPACASNPLKYRFSWNPKGVLMSCLNSARYKMNGEIISIEGENLLSSATVFHSPWIDLDLECIPNRDSLLYMEKYGIESADTCFRGTLRYTGYCEIMNVFRLLGLFDSGPTMFATWRDVLEDLCGARLTDGKFYATLLATTGGNHALARVAFQSAQFLGLFDAEPLAFPDSMLDSFAFKLKEVLSFRAEEADMVLMHHEIVGSFENEPVRERHSTTLRVHGVSDMTAMSKTVGYTVAIAAEMMLDNEISQKGLLIPTLKNLYNPILDRIEKEHIVFDDKRMRLVDRDSWKAFPNFNS